MGAYTNNIGSGVAEDVFAVTPSDAIGVSDGTTTVPLIRALYITTGGTLKYTNIGGVDRTITVPSGFLLDCAMKRVYATGTASTGLLGYV